MGTIRRPARVRAKNQVTIPAAIAERIGLREGDFLDLVLDENKGIGIFRRARLATAGTPDAELALQSAEADVRAGRVRVFESPEDFAAALEDGRLAEFASGEAKRPAQEAAEVRAAFSKKRQEKRAEDEAARGEGQSIASAQ
jgi:AbrB family looped-hinge helix DNA binding protein